MAGLLALAVALSMAAAPAGSAAGGDPIAAVAWLSGCWASTDDEPGSGEYWTPAAGGSLLGVSRTVRGGRTAFHEFMQIRSQDDGSVVFTAHPSGQPGSDFPLVESGSQFVVFENPEHDFPQRITYRRDGNRLLAWIERIDPAQGDRVDFSMRRIPCDPGAGADGER